ncbi:MAG: oligosaccharide flippase family protein [Cyclobacteriaceae bacterium]
MGQIKQLASQTLVYGVSSVLGRVLNYLLVPLYTAVFNPEQYGVVTELYAYVAFLNILYTYGIETTYFRFATKSDRPEKYYNLAQTSVLLTSIIFSGLLYVMADFIAAALGYHGNGVYLEWLALILAIDAVIAVPFARLRLEKKAMRFASLKLFNIGLNIGLNLFFILICPYIISSGGAHLISFFYNPDLGVGYIFLANLIANAAIIPLMSGYFGNLKLTLNKELIPMLIYAAPLMVIGFAGVTNEMLSRALLKYLLPTDLYPGQSNLEILGIFGACYKLSVFMTLAVQAFRYAFEPFFFSKSGEADSPELFARVMHGFIIFGSFSWLMISVLLPDLAPIFLRQQAYLSGLNIVPWLLGGGLFLGIYYNLSVWYKLTDKTSYGAWISISGAVITVILNFILIPAIGYIGSAIATFATYFTMVGISYVLGQRHYPIPYFVGRGSFYLLLSGLLIVGFYFCGLEGYLRYLVSFGLMIIFSLAVWLVDIRSGFIQIPKRK